MASRMVLVGNKSYGLFIGETDAKDADIIKEQSVRLKNCRHVAQWFGKTGGISSLAAFGPCGNKAKQSKIGAPCPSALLGGIVNVFDLSKEAIAAFDAIESSGT